MPILQNTSLAEHSTLELLHCVILHLIEVQDRANCEIPKWEIISIKLTGSMLNNTHSTDSDLDVIIEYLGRVPDYVIFNLLKEPENSLQINEVNVDFLPYQIYSS